MLKVIKNLFYTIFLLVFLMVIGLSAMVLLVDPNKFKDTLSNQFYIKTGQKLVIKGNLSWRLFPWLGLQVHDVQLNTSNSFSNSSLATLQEADLSLKLLPLLDRKITLGTITLNGVTINLIKNSDGTTNWQNFFSASKNPSTNFSYKPTSGPLPLTLSISNVKLTHVNIFLTDKTKNQNIALTDINFRSHDLTLGKTLPFTLDGNFAFSKPILSGKIKLSGKILWDPIKQEIAVDDWRLTSQIVDPKLTSKALTFNAELTAALNLPQQTFTLSNMKGNFGNLPFNLTAQGSQIFTAPQLQGDLQIASFNPRELLKTLEISSANQLKPTVLVNTSLRSHFLVNKQKMALNDLQIKLDNSHLNGNLFLTNSKDQASTFALNLDQINLNNYNLATQKTKTHSPAQLSAEATAPSSVPFSGLQKLHCRGQLTIHNLNFKNLQASNLALHLLANKGIIDITPITADLYQGHYTGSIKIDARQATPYYIFHGTIAHLKMANLYNAVATTQNFQITGDANAQANITTAGVQSEQIFKNLNGNLKFSLTDGFLKGIDINHQMEIAAALFKKQMPQTASGSNQTAFNSLSGTIIFNNGIAANNDLSLQAPTLQVSGTGQVNLFTQAINYELLVKSPGDAIHAINQLQQFLGGAIPIHITGNYHNPQIYPDEKVIAKATIKYLVKKNTSKIADTLDKKFNGLGSMLQKQLGNLLH